MQRYTMQQVMLCNAISVPMRVAPAGNQEHQPLAFQIVL
jgi:hypothetical protein